VAKLAKNGAENVLMSKVGNYAKPA